MQLRRVVLLVGSLWELVRFFLVLLLLALLFATSSGPGTWVFPWLVFAGSGNLLIAVGGALLALLPARYEGILGLLRLGKALSLFAFLLLVLSGAFGLTVDREVITVGPILLTLGPVTLGVFVLDFLFLAVLFGVKRVDAPRAGLVEDAHPPW